MYRTALETCGFVTKELMICKTINYAKEKTNVWME